DPEEVRESVVRRRCAARSRQGEPAAGAARGGGFRGAVRTGGQPVKRAIAASILLGIALRAAAAAAEEHAPVVITPENEKRTYRIAVQRFAAGDSRLVEDFRGKVIRALEFSGVFTKIEDNAFLGPVTTPPGREDAQLECPNWSQIGADGFLEGEIARSADGIAVSF